MIYLDISAGLADAEGALFPGMTIDGLHLSVKGYEVWASALRPLLEKLLGPRGEVGLAPAATGDPSLTPNSRS